MRVRCFVALLCFLAVMVSSCQKEAVNPNKNLTLESFSDMKTKEFAVSSTRIREELDHLMAADKDSTIADYRTRSYYLRRNAFLWIDRHGVDERADSVLAVLHTVDQLGFSQRKFCVGDIERDLKRLRNLDFDAQDNRINHVLARLEYHLTKGYLRYVAGQRYGFVNPSYVFNHLDVLEEDSGSVSYRGLFDIPMQRGGKQFYRMALHKVAADSVAEFLRAAEPRGQLYKRLKDSLATVTDGHLRQKLLCNMERCRWRLNDYPERHKKYVLVNLPSFLLHAVDGDEVLSMRVGVGSLDTKTPLMTSEIKRMDVNPQWVIPRSIIKKSIIGHARNTYYFAQRHYFVRDRKTGKRVDPALVTRNMLESTDYNVVQEGGKGNSLGRIIFRFDNNYSIFLHDTSSRDVFSRGDRDVSHGCIRLAKPFDLAVFLLQDKNDKVIEKIRYSMSADVSRVNKHDDKASSNGDSEWPTDTLDRAKLVGSVKVEPHVPLFITYFTLYPGTDGVVHEYADVYGYDQVIYRILRNYI